jgi:IS30 family transposase
MTFTEQELEQIEQLASLYLSVTDIATVMGVRPEELRKQIRIKDDPVAIAYQKGKTMRKVQLRKQEIQLAQVGSPLALENARLALIDMEDDE